MSLHAYDKASWLRIVWEALEEWQDTHEGRNPAGGETYEKRLDDLNTAMAWIHEELEVEHEDV